MERRRAPQTDEGWYALHDFRRIDWDAWREAPERRRERALEAGMDFFESVEATEDGESALYTVLGNEADLLSVHLRETPEDLDAITRRFEGTPLAEFTERAYSYLSVTEVSGYISQEYFEEEGDSGLTEYMKTRLYPDVPGDGYVCFYPMDKRREGEDNWYDLPFEERAELMASHGEVGRKHVPEVTQVITGSVGLDDWEWGVTLFSEDPTEIKDLLQEMRFDRSSSRYADFGPFYFGRRIAPGHLPAVFSGERVPADDAHGEGDEPAAHADHGGSESPHGEESSPHGGHGGSHDTGESASGGPPAGGGGPTAASTEGDVHGDLRDLGIYAGQPRGEDRYALVLYSDADPEELAAEVEGLRDNFDHYDTHVETAVYESDDRTAVASVWETRKAADIAAGFLGDLPEVREPDDDGFGTMGMFYTVKPDYVEEFHEKFETVRDLLEGMDGHRETDLLVNREDKREAFIASRWDSKEDAMDFFASEEFRETVDWGRDVLDDRPRHVFLA